MKYDKKARFIAYVNGDVSCRACPTTCVECLGSDCECYEHQEDAPTDAEMTAWLTELGKL